MDSLYQVYFSNRTEELYRFLKEHLFLSSHPFTKRMVLVPSAAMKSWLMLQMAQDPDIGIAAGIEVGFVEPMVHKLFGLLTDKEVQQAYEPSKLELALALESIIADLPHEEEWLPMLNLDHYPRRKSKRISALSAVLADIFFDYGIYAKKMLEDKGMGWQKLLWDKLEGVFSVWNYPIRKLEAFQIRDDIDPKDCQIHVFGLSYLAPLYHQFLQKIALQIPVHHYVLSPCQKFWSDILSEKERIRLKDRYKKASESSLDALEDFLRDNNPLLANFGRLGREMACQIEACDPSSSESYVLPRSVLQHESYSELIAGDVVWQERGPLTLLEAMQSDIALLRNPREKMVFEAYDGTIQVHAAPKKMREVQTVYDVIMGLIDKHRHDACPILQKDVFVMAPNISEYMPFIKGVFESPESRLDIQPIDLQSPCQHGLIQIFLHLLQLSQGRWEASSVLQLFEYPAFRTLHDLDAEDLQTVKKWIKETGIYWGKDHMHRSELFDDLYAIQPCSEELQVGTWEYGLGRLLESLAAAGSDVSIEASQGELLGRIIKTLRSLEADLRPLRDGSKMPLDDWSKYLRCLLDVYFSYAEEEDREGHQILTGSIEAFGKSATRLKEATFSFDSIYRHLRKQLQEEKAIYKESNLQSIRFSSLLPMRAVPAKVVVLMGMEDGVFPRTEQSMAFNLLHGNPQADYYPECVDFDRYLFLESILSARDYLIISYVSHRPGETKEEIPSLLVKELLNYLDRAYCIEGETSLVQACTFKHALDPFHPKYFSLGSRFKSYSRANYLAALAHGKREKQPPYSFLNEFLAKEKECIKEAVVDLKDLAAYSKNPLKIYLNRTLGIYLDKESDRMVKSEEDLCLSNLQAFILSKEGLLSSPKEILMRAERTGALPGGAFKPLGRERIEQEVVDCQASLAACGVSITETFAIELTERCRTPQRLQDCWLFPPLVIDHVKIVGRLDTVAAKGMIVFSQDKIEKVIERWPVLLAFACLIKEHQLPIASQVIFAKEKKAKLKKIEFEEPKKLLSRYLDYYLQTKGSPSPLLPGLISSIFSGDEVQGMFEDDDEFRPQFDEYLKWLGRNARHVSLAPGTWQITAQHLFQEMFCRWYPEKSSRDSKNDSV